LKILKKTMKKFLKVVSICLALTSLATVMSGCKFFAKKVVDDPNTIVWYMRKPVSDMSRQAEVEAEANKIIEPIIGKKLKFQFIDVSAWDQKKSMLVQAGQGYDLIFEDASAYTQNAQKGVYLDITPYMTDEYMPEIMKRNDQFVWDAVTVKNKVCAIPGETFYVPYTSFAFKADIADKYNFDTSKVDSYDDLIPLFEAVKANEKGMYGLLALPELPSQRYVTTANDSVLFDTVEEKFIAEIDSPEKQEYWKTIKSFADKGYMPADAFTKTDHGAEIKTGKYAVFTGQMDASKSTNRQGFECYENKPQYGFINRNNVNNSLTCINANSTKKVECIKLLNLIWENKELSNLLAFGIEGKDYVWETREETGEPWVVANSGNNVKWSIWHNWLGPLWDQYDSTWNKIETLELRKNLNATAKKSPIIGFLPDTSKLSTEIAGVGALRTNYKGLLASGVEENYDATYAQMKQELTNAGLYTIVDEFNRQYQEWKTTQE